MRVEGDAAAALELGEVGAQALARVRVLGIDGTDLDHRGGEQPLDVAHRADEPLALPGGERCQQRLGELVAAPVELGQLREARGREPRVADAAVVRAGVDGDHPVALERAQQPAEVARVEPQAGAQRAHLAAVRPDLPQHARLAERPVAGEEVIVERADALGHRPVEAADLLDHGVGHCLTLVRYRAAGKRALAFDRAGEIAQLVEHTTENRGVPGSSPGLAIARKAPWMLDLAGSGVSSAILKKGMKRGRPAETRGSPRELLDCRPAVKSASCVVCPLEPKTPRLPP